MRGDTLYAGGAFLHMAGLPRSGIAMILGGSLSTALANEETTTQSLALLARCNPNPARSGTVIHFALPEASNPGLAVFDLEGRRVALLLDHSFLAAGQHDVALDTHAWAPGVYLYRLETRGASITQKLAIIR